jgi:hypothetical protein
MKWTLLLILSFSLFVVPVVSGEEEAPPEPTLYAGEELDPELAAMLLEKLEGNEDKINAYIEDAGIPAPLKGFTSGRYNLHIGNDTVGMVMEDGKLEEVAEGGIENPTTDIYADEELIEKIVTSDDPLEAVLEAQKTGELRKEDHGLVPKIKGFLMNIALKILDLVS